MVVKKHCDFGTFFDNHLYRKSLFRHKILKSGITSRKLDAYFSVVGSLRGLNMRRVSRPAVVDLQVEGSGAGLDQMQERYPY